MKFLRHMKYNSIVDFFFKDNKGEKKFLFLNVDKYAENNRVKEGQGHKGI